MTIYSDALKDRADYAVIALPYAQFCSMAECNLLMPAGSMAKRFDAATWTHIKCPTGAPKHMAAHRYIDTGLRVGGNDE